MINKVLKENIEREGAKSKPAKPQKQSLAAYLLTMPEIVGHDDLFERIQDDDRDIGDVFDRHERSE